MPRPIEARMKDPLWWFEQVLHLIGGLVPSGFCSFALAHWTELEWPWIALLAALCGIVPGFARELSQNWGDKPARGSLEDSLLDLGFWTLGGMLGILGALWA